MSDEWERELAKQLQNQAMQQEFDAEDAAARDADELFEEQAGLLDEIEAEIGDALERARVAGTPPRLIRVLQARKVFLRGFKTEGIDKAGWTLFHEKVPAGNEAGYVVREWCLTADGWLIQPITFERMFTDEAVPAGVTSSHLRQILAGVVALGREQH